MKSDKNIKILLSLFFTLLCRFNSEPSCPCPIRIPNPPSDLPDKNGSFSPEPEIIDNVDYGIPIVFAQMVFLKKDFSLIEPSTKEVKIQCPNGYRIPTSEEMDKLIANIGPDKIYSKFIDPLGLAGNPKLKYLTSTKSFPDKLSGSDNQSWMFKVMTLDQTKQTVKISDLSIYYEKKNFAAKCMMNTSSNNLQLNYGEKDFIIGNTYPISIKSSNIVSYLWQWGNGSSTSSTVNIKFASNGCSILQVWVKNMANAISYSCIEKYGVQPFGSERSTSLDAKKITQIKLGYTSEPEKSLFFSPGRIPIAPKPTGGLYLVYTDMNTQMLNVSEFDANLNKINEINLKIQAYPFDAISTDWGLVIYAKDANNNNSSFILGYTREFKKKFQRTIMNNGDLPKTKNSDQIAFYDEKGQLLYGLNAIFKPEGGKLAYGRGKIGLIFSHYNHFGMKSDNTRNDHTGDTYIFFDENGQNETYAWSWGASHSLIQSHIYDGRYFVTASLGDMYPENIRVCIIDSTKVEKDYDSVKKGNFKHPQKCSNIVPDKVPGNGGGKSCARLGGLVNKGIDYALIYSIRACNIKNGIDNQERKSNVSEIAIISFQIENFDFKNVIKNSVIKNTSKLVNLRAGKYGDKILIAYNEDSNQTGNDTGKMSYTGVEEMSFALVGFDGTVYAQPFKYSPTAVSTSDDMRFLSDGRLAWGYIDFNKNVSLYSTIVPGNDIRKTKLLSIDK